MTSPAFPHLGTTGVIQDPGLGGVLGQGYQGIARMLLLRRESDQRQQQMDQLGQYYQGQVHEMQRLRDQQEQAAIAERQQAAQLAAKRAEVDRLYPLKEGMDERQTFEIMSKRAIHMAQYGDPMAGPLSNILNAMRPKEPGKPIERDPTKELRDPTGQTVISPAQPKADTGKRVERTADLGNKVHVWYTDGTEGEMPKGRIPGSGDGGITPYQGMQEDARLRAEFRTETREIDKALLNNRKIDDKTVEEATTKNSLPAQYQIMVSFIQALDNSVVREGEVALYRSSEALRNKANNFLTKYGEGKAQLISPESIRQMAQLTRKAQEKLTAARNKIKNHYIQQAKRAGRQNPEELFRADDEGDDDGASRVDNILSGKKP